MHGNGNITVCVCVCVCVCSHVVCTIYFHRMQAPRYKAIEPTTGRLQRLIVRPEVCLCVHTYMCVACTCVHVHSCMCNTWFICVCVCL